MVDALIFLPLEGLRTLIPWDSFRKPLKNTLAHKDRSTGERPPFDDILMFKIIVLQALYNLSDDQTKYQIRDRLSFMRFLGIVRARVNVGLKNLVYNMQSFICITRTLPA